MIDLKNYKNYLLDNEISDNTIKSYLNTLRQLDEFLAVHSKPLDKESLIMYKRSLLEFRSKTGKPYSIKTINQKIIVINIFLNWLEKPELTLKAYKTQNDLHRESIDKKEYKALLKYADEETRNFILLIGNTGMRISEACSITVDDLSKKNIYIRNKGKIRMVSIPQFVKKKLKRYCESNKITGIIFSKTQTRYRKSLKAAASKAKIKKDRVYPHSIRHFFAKEFIENGGDSTSLQQMLGHENINTTTIYTRLNDKELSSKFGAIHNE